MIIKYNKNRLYLYIYICIFRFLKQIKFKQIFNMKTLGKLNLRKGLFFKKKYSPKILASKRLSVLLRKRKKLKNFKTKRVDKGNFFFKKFFFKTLLKTRKYLRRFFFFNSKVRQTKITNYISRNAKLLKIHNSNYEFTVLNVFLRSHFCLSFRDALLLIKGGFVYINGLAVTQHSATLLINDVLQLKLSYVMYRYIQFSKKLLKKKLALFRLNSWKFFKQRLLRQQQQLKPQKRKTPKYLYLFFLFKLNTPQYLEIDYFSLSIFLLRPYKNKFFTTYYISKLFSYRLFSLYNFKKIN